MTETEHKLIGSSDHFLHVLDQVSQLTLINRPILIVGERGTGKELIAERLHYLSDRWSRPLVKMNCAAIQESLLESELFGHEAGSFTGAVKRHIGRFERASGGTLFLDELATLSLNTQEKLLRVIEYGEYERLGGSETLRTNTRLVAATNIDLPSLANRGRFRDDLLDRLAFDVITVPPLRARQEDIPQLAEHFAVKMSRELERPLFSGFSAYAMGQLLDYPWPGNIRELKNVVERAVYRQSDTSAPIGHLTFDPFASPFRPTTQRGAKGDAATPPATERLPEPQFPLDFYHECNKTAKHLLQQAMVAAQNNQKSAAKLLKLSYHQLRNQLKKHGITNH